MNDFVTLLQQGTANAWFFIPTAIIIGALHGLEPGHSKTMMAAFIIAIRGTVTQAILLGLSAAISHSLVIWVLAASALALGKKWDVESSEPYFQIGSGILVLGTAFWMAWRTHRDVEAEKRHHHHHGDHGKIILNDHSSEEYQDDHEKEHAREIEKHFANRHVTTGQVIVFGLSGGLLPCPAAFSILVLCLQLKEFTLGFALVLCFSIGLALVLVSVGSATAWGMKHATKKIKGFASFARRAPYVSSAILLLLGCYLIWSGTKHLN